MLISGDCPVLLVGESSENRSLLATILGAAGYSEISQASCGQSALQILRSQTVSVVITEIDLPVLDGWRLCRLIRSGVFSSPSTIPIIATVFTWCERIAETTAREFGVNAILPLEHQQRLPDLLRSCLQESSGRLSNPSVLVVEDNPDTSRIVARVLNQRFEVEHAFDGVAGLRAWTERRHDLVLLDMMLPELGGADVLRAIVQVDPSQAVVVMTAHGDVDLAVAMMVEGAADYIAKPFRAEQLRRVCELAVRREDYLVSNAQYAARLKSLQQSKDDYRLVSESHQRLLNHLGTVVLEMDLKGRILFLNKAWARLTGFSVNSSIGREFASFLPAEGEGGCREYTAWIESLVQCGGREGQIELCLVGEQGRQLWVECRVDIVADSEKGLSIFGCLDDISEKKETRQELEYLAMHDHMTGLYNRHYFDGILKQMAASSFRGNGPHALLYIDLDHFKVLNDTYGHSFGDAVLSEISTVIMARIRRSDVLCRIGGDEYAVLLSNTEAWQAKQIADEIRYIVQNHQGRIGGRPFCVGCSVGISIIDGLGTSPEEYLKQADVALYVAKRRGRNRVHLFNPADGESEELRNSVNWVRVLKRAIVEDSLVVHFQPVLDIKQGKIAYYEALVRMQPKDEDLVLPAEFIPALERAGEMPMLDYEVIRRVIRILGEQPAALERVAINLSAQVFREDDLIPLIEGTFREFKVDPARVIFELTESASMSNVSATQKIIKRLNELGCGFVVDDFGTGFSTFGYLKQFPAHSIKIDGSFICGLDQNSVDQTLVRAMNEVARTLGKETVAEFVETEAVFDLIRSMGINYAQGYYIGRPVGVEDLNGYCSPGQ